MAKSYYELLDVPPTACSDEIKRAFRREIAKYHPDKVQHLGKEFQEIAAVKAAELTQAYKILTDETLRPDYDEQLASGEVPAAYQPPPSPSAPQAEPPPSGPTRAARPQQERTPPPEPKAPPGSSVFQQDRAGASDLVYRATVARFRQVLQTEFGQYEEVPLQGFQVTCVPKPAFFSLKFPPRVVGRFVPHVDAAAVSETWAMASKMKHDKQRDLCVFVLGPSVAPAGELATAIAEQRRKPMPAGGKLVMVPVNTRTWSAHVPQDAPPVVKSLLARLKSAI
jgi:hypothetical protein